MADRMGIKIFRKIRAQVSLETTLALICVIVLLFGSIKIFVWFTERIARRQEDYAAQRIDAGRIDVDGPEVQVDESNYEKLDIFGESD